MKYQIKCHQHIFEPEAFFPQCHASTIEHLPNGDIVAAWFAGQHEKSSDVAIWLSVRKNGEWDKPRIVASGNGVPCWNPVLFYNACKLMLFYKLGNEIHTWQTMYKESTDGGGTWSAERELVPGDIGGRGPVKNKCILLRNGNILAPASVEDATRWDCFVDIFDGNDWCASGLVPRNPAIFTGLGIIQPTLWEDDDSIVYMLTRSTEGAIYSSKSLNGGQTWLQAVKTELPNNNCGIDVARLIDGRLILVYNPVSGNWVARSPIAFSLSEDNGATWSKPEILDYVPCDPKLNIEDAEFSYPAVIAHGNDVFITYTWKRRTIAFWHISFPLNRRV